MEETEEEQQEQQGLTAKDIETMGANLGINKGSCTYDKFVQALVKMVNVFLGNELMSDRINLDCLKVMEGQSCELMDAVTEVFLKHEKAVKEQESYKKQYKNERDNANREANTHRQINSALRLSTNASAILMAMVNSPDAGSEILHNAANYTNVHE